VVDFAALLPMSDFLVMDICIFPQKNFDFVLTPSLLHPTRQTHADSKLFAIALNACHLERIADFAARRPFAGFR